MFFPGDYVCGAANTGVIGQPRAGKALRFADVGQKLLLLGIIALPSNFPFAPRWMLEFIAANLFWVLMKKLISISENLDVGGRPARATADADYDEVTEEVRVQLRFPDCSESPQIVRSRASNDEASDVARDIFRSWIRGLVKQGVARIAGM